MTRNSQPLVVAAVFGLLVWLLLVAELELGGILPASLRITLMSVASYRIPLQRRHNAGSAGSIVSRLSPMLMMYPSFQHRTDESSNYSPTQWGIALERPLQPQSLLKGCCMITTNQSRFQSSCSRRNVLQTIHLGLSFCLCGGVVVAASPSEVDAATALASTSFANASSTRDPLAANRDQLRVRQLLQSVPTFVIVDDSGVPFMVVGEDARVTGYFFLDYNEAKRVLQLARSSADKAIALSRKEDKNQDELINPWKMARISSVPLDIAVTLVTQSTRGRRLGGNNFFQLAPSAQDIEDALQITQLSDLAENRVPLFYLPSFEISTLALSERTKSSSSSPESETNATNITPVYFRRQDFAEAYRKQYPGQPVPEPQVAELFAILKGIALEQQSESKVVNREDSTSSMNGHQGILDSIMLFAPRQSQEMALRCNRQMGMNVSPFVLGERILVL